MFTADKARSLHSVDSNERAKRLDERIQREVESSIRAGRTTGELRVYSEDWFIDTIEEELENRGFHSIQVPKIILKGDVSFSWSKEDSDD